MGDHTPPFRRNLSERLDAGALLPLSSECALHIGNNTADAETGYTPETPSEMVDAFLSDISDDANRSHCTWRHVKSLQDGTTEAADQVAKSWIALERQSPLRAGSEMRSVERGWERHATKMSRKSLDAARIDSTAFFLHAVLPHIDEVASSLMARLRVASSVKEEISSLVKGQMAGKEASDFGALCAAYTEARIDDHLATAKIETFLQQDEVVPAFCERLLELASDASRGIVEYPGLLELLATHGEQHKNQGILQKAIDRTIGNPGQYAEAFLSANLAKEGQGNQELSAILSFIKFTSDHILGPEFGVDREGSIARFAAQWEAWPQPLKPAVEAHAQKQASHHYSGVEQALKPFVRSGRLYVTNSPKATQDRTGQKRQQTGRSKNNQKPPKLKTKAPGSPEDVSTEITPAAISQFGYLESADETGRNRFFSLEPYDSIDDILALEHFSEYLAKYGHEPQLASTVRSALGHLTVNSCDPNRTKPWLGVGYRLVGDSQKQKPRRLRRISLAGFPDVERDSIAHKTRIAYGIEKVNPDNEEGDSKGRLALALFGIFIKKDIERIQGELPRRR